MTPSKAGKLGYEKTSIRLNAYNEKQQAAAQARWVPSKCLTCGGDIPYEKRQNKFCNHSCAASTTNRGVQHNKAKPRINIEGKGADCGVPAAKPGINPDGKCLGCGAFVGIQRKFCGGQCQRDLDFKTRASIVASTGDLWQGWHHEGRIRNFLLRTRPHQCDVCGTAVWQGSPTPLVMDHIDGDSANWDVKNLRLICPNCDAQTTTYKGRNRGRGRHARKIRYQQGLSY